MNEKILNRLLQFTPAQQRSILDRAVINSHVAADGPMRSEVATFSELIRLVRKEVLESIVTEIVESAPVCACGHSDLYHEDLQFRCHPMGRCDCMIFVPAGQLTRI